MTAKYLLWAVGAYVLYAYLQNNSTPVVNPNGTVTSSLTVTPAQLATLTSSATLGNNVTPVDVSGAVSMLRIPSAAAY